MADRISSADAGYLAGDLSVYPQAIDDFETLYEARNNATTKLLQTVGYASRILVVEDTSLFPDKGQLRIGPPPGEPGEYEMVYYGKKTSNTFQDLIRGFAGSSPRIWKAGETYVSATVFSDHHNAIKDAIINIEHNLGLKNNPDPESLNGILKKQEVRFLSPKPLFRAFPIKGSPPLKVRFQNFTFGAVAKFLWDFGDGGISLEQSPTHTYNSPGIYTVKLNVVTVTGAQGVATKIDYIKVDVNESPPFFYVDSIDNPYSIKTATEMGVSPKEFRFVDQTRGNIVYRNWIFGDGNTYTEMDPDVHEVRHVYELPGEYTVTELVQFDTGRLKKFQLPQPLVVL